MIYLYNYLSLYNNNYYYYTGRFIKNQQKYTKLLQLFTSAWRNKNTERNGEKKIHQDVGYTT